MKRLYITSKYRRLIRLRQDRALAVSRRHRGLRSADPERYWPTLRVVAPFHYSFVENPEDAIRFVSRLHCPSKQRKLFVDLARAETITCDAISVLAATIESDLCQPSVSGNWPEKERPRQIVLDSGFNQRVRSYDPQPSADRGKIFRRDVYLNKVESTVATALAGDLVQFARLKLGRSLADKPSYGVLIDVMDNTFTHASEVMAGQVSWWATVYCDIERKKACYCFVDLGVGIFKSKSFQQRIRYLPITLRGRPEERLKALVERRIPSRTGLPYRGKGLPWIYESGVAGRIESLVIIANDVYARPLRNEYRSLSNPFHGTFLYWET
jgi:hypothetical protein